MINYNIEGDKNLPVLVFSNSLGTDWTMWNAVTPKLLPFFRILRYDTRGLGKSTLGSKKNFFIKDLAEEVLAILDKENIEKCYFCGLSMGGLIGQYLAIHHANRLEKLIICNTAAKIGVENTWNERITHVLEHGTASIWAATLSRWFTPDFQNDVAQFEHIKTVFCASDSVGYTANCAAIRDADFRNDLSKITTPTLVIAGAKDPVTTVADGQFFIEHIPNTQMVVLETAHLSSVEKPTEFALAVLNFTFGGGEKESKRVGEKESEKVGERKRVGEKESEKVEERKRVGEKESKKVGESGRERERIGEREEDVFGLLGMTTRRSVLGDAHVDRAEANKTPFDADFQAFITKYAWGEIWSRPHLTKRERSMITIAVLATLGHHEEVEMHLRACKNTGATEEDIKEVLLHIGIYAGVPASNIAYKIAKKVFG
jgi:3-oxoadipate enol-lactonase / 4-carboxymuconolactone decarboxylase